MEPERERSSRKRVLASCALALLAAATFASHSSRPSLLAATTITLTPTTSPSTGQPGVTVMSVTGSGFPSGTIPAANVTVTCSRQPAGHLPQRPQRP